MAQEPRREMSPASELTEAQLWAVIKVGGLAVLLSFAVPLYYSITLVVPQFTTIVPPMVSHFAMALGMLVVFPAMFLYARVLAARPGRKEPDESELYGVNDRWERENL